MEKPHQNPNEVLTGYFIGDRLVLIPVIEYYRYLEHPELALAELALRETLAEEENE